MLFLALLSSEALVVKINKESSLDGRLIRAVAVLPEVPNISGVHLGEKRTSIRQSPVYEPVWAREERTRITRPTSPKGVRESISSVYERVGAHVPLR